MTVHQDRIMLTKRGELVVLASVVIDSVPNEMTIFEDEEELNKTNQHELDDHSKYIRSQKLIGVFRW